MGSGNSILVSSDSIFSSNGTSLTSCRAELNVSSLCFSSLWIPVIVSFRPIRVCRFSSTINSQPLSSQPLSSLGISIIRYHSIQPCFMQHWTKHVFQDSITISTLVGLVTPAVKAVICYGKSNCIALDTLAQPRPK